MCDKYVNSLCVFMHMCVHDTVCVEVTGKLVGVESFWSSSVLGSRDWNRVVKAAQ